MTNNTDAEIEILQQEAEALRARVRYLQSRETDKEARPPKKDDQETELQNKPLGMEYFTTPKGVVVFILIVVVGTAIISRVLGL